MKKIILLSIALLAGYGFAGWTYDPSAKTITDGNWVLTVSKYDDGLSVNNVVSVTDPREIDLSQDAIDADGNTFDILAVGLQCFMQKEVEVVRLGDQMKSLGKRAFYKCLSLKEVVPLLPSSLTTLGQGAFSGCTSLGGDVVFPENSIDVSTSWHSAAESYGWFCATKITSCDMSSATVSTIVDYSFAKCTDLKTVKLPKEVKTLGTAAFQNASSLRNVEPFLPDTLTQIGKLCFQNCSSLEGDLILGGPDPVYCVFNNNSGDLGSFCGCSKIKSAKILTQIGAYVSNSTPPESPGVFPQGLFSGCGGLVQVELYRDVSTVSRMSFAHCTSLSNVVFHGSLPDTFHETAFNNTANTRIFHSRFDDTWRSIAEKLTFTEMSDALKTKYLAVYPDEKVFPLGQVKVGTISLWLSDIIPGLEENVVHIESSSKEAELSGSGVSPDYGVFTGFENGTTHEFTAPGIMTTDSGKFTCAGYSLSYETRVGSREFSTPVTNQSTVCTVTQQDHRVWRLIWLWEPMGYALTADVNDADAGRVACSPEITGVYEEGANVTVTATPKSGCHFIRWYGDVPEGKEFDRTITLTMDEGKRVAAVFSKPWTYDSSAKTITDGNWVLSVTGVNGIAGGLSVSTVLSVNDPLVIDFSQNVNDAGGNLYAIVAIAKEAFKAQPIRFAYLGDEMRTIGVRAFYSCASLEWAAPLMPSKLTSLGGGAFSGCVALSGDVVFPASEISVPVDNSNQAPQHGWFYAAKITSCDLSKATMSTVPACAFSKCTGLKTVHLPKGIATLGNNAFEGASALVRVEPFLPDTVTSIGRCCFMNCSSLEGDLVLDGTEPVAATHNSNNASQGAFTGCQKIKSAKLLAPVVDSAGQGVARGMFNGCTSLERVELGESVNWILGHAFINCTALKDITFYGPVPQVAESAPFNGVTDKKIRFHVSKKDVTWMEFRATSVTPMNDELKAEYHTLYPGEPLPKGQFVLNGRKMWLCPDFGFAGFFMHVR